MTQKPIFEKKRRSIHDPISVSKEESPAKNFKGWLIGTILLLPLTLFASFFTAVVEIVDGDFASSSEENGYIIGAVIASVLIPLLVVLISQRWDEHQNNHSRFKIASIGLMLSLGSIVIRLTF